MYDINEEITKRLPTVMQIVTCPHVIHVLQQSSAVYVQPSFKQKLLITMLRNPKTNEGDASEQRQNFIVKDLKRLEQT